jgi:hypothetical protein
MTAGQEVQFVIGIGTGKTRQIIDERLSSAGVASATLVHPAATLGYDVRIGPGSVICVGVRATTNISLGRHVHLNINTTVGARLHTRGLRHRGRVGIVGSTPSGPNQDGRGCLIPCLPFGEDLMAGPFKNAIFVPIREDCSHVRNRRASLFGTTA